MADVMNDHTMRMLKMLSTVTLGYYVGSVLHRVMVVQPALLEQSVPVAAKTMRGIVRHSTSMPVTMTLGSAAQLFKYFVEYGTPREDKFDLMRGCVMLAYVPLTLGKIHFINRQFLDEDEAFENDDGKWMRLLSEWSRLHYGCATVALFLFSSIVYKET